MVVVCLAEVNKKKRGRRGEERGFDFLSFGQPI
jgi:hypothetical protein